MIRSMPLTVYILFLCTVPACYAGSDMHIQCDDLEATYIVANPSLREQGGEEGYHILFEAKEENITHFIDTMHENITKKKIFDVYVGGKIAEHYYRYPDRDYLPPLVYTPFFLMIDAGKSRENALGLARSYCPSTLPDGEDPVITLFEHMTRQNEWVRADRKKTDAARLRAAQTPQ